MIKTITLCLPPAFGWHPTCRCIQGSGHSHWMTILEERFDLDKALGDGISVDCRVYSVDYCNHYLPLNKCPQLRTLQLCKNPSGHQCLGRDGESNSCRRFFLEDKERSYQDVLLDFILLIFS